MTEELVDVVDLDDRPIEIRTLRDCKMRGLLHRAVAVLLFDSSGRLLLQKRARSKDWMPGYWDFSSTGHVRAGESYEVAAARELKEEIGVSCDLRRVSKFLAPKFEGGGMTEWEHICIFECDYDGKVTPDGVEVEETSYVTPERLREMESPPRPQLTPDSMATLAEFRKVSKRL
jgi:16S rRNA (adenine1518-N6/adenine1519-N6)-dimethyltransferase